MFNVATALLYLCLLTACSPGVDAAGEQEALNPEESVSAPPVTDKLPAEPATPPVEVAVQPLDLSVPDISDTEFSQAPGDFRPKRFDTRSLFNKQKDDPVSFSVKPNIVFGEKLLSLPEVDRGSVSVEVKTK